MGGKINKIVHNALVKLGVCKNRFGTEPVSNQIELNQKNLFGSACHIRQRTITGLYAKKSDYFRSIHLTGLN